MGLNFHCNPAANPCELMSMSSECVLLIHFSTIFNQSTYFTVFGYYNIEFSITGIYVHIFF